MNFIAETQKLQNYLKVQDYKAVVYGCEKLINKFPNNPFLFNLLGLALHGSGNYLIAIDRYKKPHVAYPQIICLNVCYITCLLSNLFFITSQRD